MALNQVSLAHLNQYAELDLLFTNNPVAVAANSAFAARRVLFAGSMVLCYGYRDAANASTAGFTTAKKLAKKISAKSAGGITGKGRSYAILKGNAELQGQMEVWTEAFMYKTGDTNYAGVIQSVFDELNPFITSDPIDTPPFFTALQLASMQADKTAFVGKLNKYKAARADINTAKKDFRIIMIPEMKEHIRFFLGFLNDLEFAFPDFVTEFRAIIEKLEILGRRHQGTTAIMKNAVTGEVLNSIGTFEILNYPPVAKPKSGKTNTMGEIALIKLKIGTWDGVFKAPGYKDQPVILVVASKKIIHYEIMMMPL